MKCPVCQYDFPETKGGKPRSADQHRRYFAVMRAVYYYWPETHEEQFSNAEELRKWLQMKAGYREIGAKVPLAGIRKEKALLLAEAAIRAAGSYAVSKIHGDILVVFRPRSIAFNKLSHADFCKLNNAVEEIIIAEAGRSGDEFLDEYRKLNLEEKP